MEWYSIFLTSEIHSFHMVQPLITPFKITVVTLSCSLSVNQEAHGMWPVFVSRTVSETHVIALALLMRELKSKEVTKVTQDHKTGSGLRQIFWGYFLSPDTKFLMQTVCSAGVFLCRLMQKITYELSDRELHKSSIQPELHTSLGSYKMARNTYKVVFLGSESFQAGAFPWLPCHLNPLCVC